MRTTSLAVVTGILIAVACTIYWSPGAMVQRARMRGVDVPPQNFERQFRRTPPIEQGRTA